MDDHFLLRLRMVVHTSPEPCYKLRETCMQLFFVGTHGVEDPTRAAMPFHLAQGALATGDTPTIALLADAAILAKPGIADGVFPVGLAPLSEMLQDITSNNVRIFV